MKMSGRKHLYVAPIINEQQSVSFAAAACSRGSIRLSADRCRGEAFRLITAHTESEGDRKGEGLAKCSHVYPLSEDPLLPAYSLSSAALSSSTYTPTLSALLLICRLLPAATPTSCRYTAAEKQRQPEVDSEEGAACIRGIAKQSAGASVPTQR